MDKDLNKEVFDRFRAGLAALREELRRRGYADYIYAPYVPLVVSSVFETKDKQGE